MKVVILAGGFGTRLVEETEIKPKPLVEIGGYPILWHIMKHYAFYGFNEFIIALGYKGELIKKYFMDYLDNRRDIRIDFRTNEVNICENITEDWSVDLIFTGAETMTGGRLKRLEDLLRDSGTFMLTYGDGVADVNLPDLLRLHKTLGKTATVTAVRPAARFGGLSLQGDSVEVFIEKPQIGEGWINGGFMVFEPDIFDNVQDDRTILETDVLESLAAKNRLAGYRHEGFWQCVDTMRDLKLLNRIWEEGSPPWKLWK